MMLSHPVLLGFIWSLLVLSTSGQSQISNTESNKVYAYSYHFQHNGTTNSKEILRSVLGADPEFALDPADGKSIVKTFSSPGIRGFFTKGVLPAGPISQSFSNGISSPYSAIRRIVESNLQPPREVATGLLPPISPDISREFPGDFNSVNHIGNVFRNQDDFPKIPPPPPPFSNNVGNRNVETFSRDTPDGGKIVGEVETFSYNPPPVSNSISRIEENSQGYRRNENILNNNREVTGHRTQSYFRQHYRTVTPNLESNDFNQNSRVDSRNSVSHNNNNQWWNGLNVLGRNNGHNINHNNNVNPPAPDISNEINRNINEIQHNINRAFGARLSGFRRQNNQVNAAHNNRQNNFGAQNGGNYFNPNQNNNPLPINTPLHNNPPFPNVPNMPFARIHTENNQQNINNNNAYPNVPNPGFNNNLPNMNIYPNHQAPNNAFNNNPNVNVPFNKETEKKVLNLIENVRSHLNNLQTNNQRSNNIGQTWDDDVPRNINNDWSSRQPNLNRRPFSNGHSGPSNGHQPADILKKTFDSLMANRNLNIPRNQGGNYRNVDGGGVEKVFGVDKIVEGPNSFSRNQQRGYERDFQVNSNRGYSRSNQWSSNTVRRLDAQSSRPDFSKDFIDVFRDEK